VFKRLVLLLGAAAFVQPKSSARELFSGERAWLLLEAQLAAGPRIPGSPGHSRTRDWLLAELRKVARNVVRDDFTGKLDGDSVPLTNLSADLGPPGPRPILLGAHWDSRPFADQDPDPAKRDDPVPGANDGASGVAVLLEAARVMRPAVPVRVVFFDGEDLGRELAGFFLGSRRFASRLGKERPRWGVVVDMVGDKDLEIRREQLSRDGAGDVIRKIWSAARRTGHASAFPDRDGPLVYDDHWPLLQAGVPVADLIDFNYGPWHTTFDTADKCSPKSLQAVGRTLVAAIEAEIP
jgi:hypothetical protein